MHLFLVDTAIRSNSLGLIRRINGFMSLAFYIFDISWINFTRNSFHRMWFVFRIIVFIFTAFKNISNRNSFDWHWIIYYSRLNWNWNQLYRLKKSIDSFSVVNGGATACCLAFNYRSSHLHISICVRSVGFDPPKNISTCITLIIKIHL